MGLFGNKKKYYPQDQPQQPVYPGYGYPVQYPPQQWQAYPPMQPPAMQPAQPANAGLGSAMQPEKRQEVSALSHLDQRSTEVLSQAQQETTRIKQEHIQPDQLLYALLFDKDVFKLLEQNGLKVADISREIQAKEKEGTFAGQPTLSDTSKRIFEDAYAGAKKRESDFVSPEDMLVALLDANVETAKMFENQGVPKEKLREKMEKSGGMPKGKIGFLDKFGIDLTQQAREGVLDPVSERDKEIDRMIHILLRRIKNNPIIIGDAGVGKTAIVEGLAQLIAQGKVPAELKDKRIIQIDVASLVAGASHRGEFEERLRNVIQEAQSSNGQVILFIDEIHTLIGTGDSGGALDASNIIKPFLARGQLQIIGSTTTLEYRQYFEKDKAFERRFQTVLCEEPSEESAIKMIQVLQPKYEKFHGVTLSPEAIAAAVKLSKRYIGERFLPDKAVDVIDEASAEVKLQRGAGKRSENVVKRDDVDKVISNWTGIPISKLNENESAKLLRLEDEIHKRLINQEKAVKAVAEAVRRGRVGLANVMRPIASFIFLGPTGTGKTELAKTLAEILFGTEEAMIRLDMSEYMEKHEVAKLIGAPPGYVGYEEGGQLTEAVRLKPYSVVLLDEVEKAHPDVFNILLQLLEDGILTDNKGNTISFKNTIVICTSNIGSTLIQQYLMQTPKKDSTDKQTDIPQDSISQKEQQGVVDNEKKALDPNKAMAQKAIDKERKLKELHDLVWGELHKFFRPELLNRFDEVIIFEPLGPEVMVDITKLRIQATRKLLKEQNIDINVSQKALEQLAKDGYDPAYGARPLRRLVQQVIETPIATLILSKTFMTGDVIDIDYDLKEEKYTFTKGAKPATANISVTIQNMQFTPQNLTLSIPPETKVTWENKDTVAHTVTFDNPLEGFPPSSETIEPGKSYSVTFSKIGPPYTYHSTVNPSMTGTIQTVTMSNAANVTGSAKQLPQEQPGGPTMQTVQQFMQANGLPPIPGMLPMNPMQQYPGQMMPPGYAQPTQPSSAWSQSSSAGQPTGPAKPQYNPMTESIVNPSAPSQPMINPAPQPGGYINPMTIPQPPQPFPTAPVAPDGSQMQPSK